MRAQLYAAGNGRPLEPIRSFEGHTGGILQVAVSPDGKTAVSASEDTTLRVWDVATGKSLRTLQGHFQAVSCVVFAADGVHVASGSHDGSIRIWNTKTGDLESLIERHQYGICRLAYAGPGRIISSGFDDAVRVWDIAEEKELRRFVAPHQSAGALAVSSDGASAAICGDGTVRLVDLLNGEEIRQYNSAASTQFLRFSGDDKTITAITMEPPQLVIWNKDDGSIVRQVKLEGRMYSPNLSPDGKHLIAGWCLNAFALYDAETGKLSGMLGGLKSYSWACAFSPDGRYLIGGCKSFRPNDADPVLRLWDLGPK